MPKKGKVRPAKAAEADEKPRSKRAASKGGRPEFAGFGGEGLATSALEAIVFGKEFLTAKQGTEDDEGKGKEAAQANERALFGLREKKRKRKPSKAEEEEEEEEEGKQPLEQSVKKAAWHDDDDENLKVDIGQKRKLKKRDAETEITGQEYESRLRELFVKVHGGASWAEERKEPEADSDASDEEDFVPTSKKILVGEEESLGIGALKPNKIAIERRKNVDPAGGGEKGPSAVSALQFHPTSDLLLTAGSDKRLSFFNVDGQDNPKVSSYFFTDYPISEACFSPSGDQVLLTSSVAKKPLGRMWWLDVRTGTHHCFKPRTLQMGANCHHIAVGPNPAESPGFKASKLFSVLHESELLVCDVATKHPIRSIQLSSPGVASVFSATRDTIWTADEDCMLYEWDLGSGRCLQKKRELYATGITALSLGRQSPYAPRSILAVGTKTGNVDLFDAGVPKLPEAPYKTIDNLTTQVNVVRFHSSSELLAISSGMRKTAVKLVHTSSGTVFANWPGMKTRCGVVSAIDFSKQSGYMALGNQSGHVQIYQLAHFERRAAL